VSGLMSVFQWISLTMMALARLMMPALVIAAPFLALVGVLQVTRGHTALASLWDMFTASILAVAKFGIASAVMTLVMTAIFRSETLNPGWKVFLLIIISVIGIMITKPIRTLKTIIPGMDPNKALMKLSALTGVLGTFAAAKAGGAAATEDALEQHSRARFTPRPWSFRGYSTCRSAAKLWARKGSIEAVPPSASQASIDSLRHPIASMAVALSRAGSRSGQSSARV